MSSIAKEDRRNESGDIFGVVTGCHRGDIHFAKATCASVRYFMPDVPICVIADGDVETHELENVYGAFILRINELDESIKGHITGTSKTKFVAFVDGPFEKFLWLDADAIIWGDIRQSIDLFGYHWTICGEWTPTPVSEISWIEARKWVDHFFFNTDLLKIADPDFDWSGRVYSSAGCFAARKGILSFDDLLRIEKLEDRFPGLFKFWDQGMVHYLLFKAMDEGRWQARVTYLQLIPNAVGKATAEKRMLDIQRTLHNKGAHVVHFCGEKPYILNRKALSWPMTKFRLLHYQNLYRNWGSLGKFFGVCRIGCEEFSWFRSRLMGKIKRMLRLDIV
jgi:hypothetical protein